MRIVLLLVAILLSARAHAESLNFPDLGQSVHFGLTPFGSEPAESYFGTTDPPTKRTYIGDGLADALGIDMAPPEPGSCRLILIPSFKVICISN